ncbi:MAG: hypothetical protein ACRESN_23695, partial [Pseudomonas sp.]
GLLAEVFLHRLKSYLSLRLEEKHGAFVCRRLIPSVYSAAPPAVIFPAGRGASRGQFPAAQNPRQVD